MSWAFTRGNIWRRGTCKIFQARTRINEKYGNMYMYVLSSTSGTKNYNTQNLSDEYFSKFWILKKNFFRKLDFRDLRVMKRPEMQTWKFCHSNPLGRNLEEICSQLLALKNRPLEKKFFLNF